MGSIAVVEKVLFVCMGNICRSPAAEAVFRHMVMQAGLQEQIHIDSAATHDYHIGHPPDRRMQAAASQRGYDLGSLRARQVSARDIVEFGYILAMDLDNLSALRQIGPPSYRHKPRLFMDYSPSQPGTEVPDPYYGGPHGFELVLDMVEEAAAGLLDDMKKKLGA
jgi:protein-tyrosine phosphatase